jgi:cytochrome c
MLPATWERTDEWYNYKSIHPEIKVLANLDEKTYQGGENGDNHPIAWYHEFDGGRAFYTGGGHTSESFSEPLFLEHILGGIRYAIGNQPKLAYDKVRTLQVPDDSRFVKIVLDEKLDEPMELAVAADGKVFYIERRGNIKLYEPQQIK